MICSGLLVPPFSSSSAKSRGQEKDLANNLCIIAEKKPFVPREYLGVVVQGGGGGVILGRSIKKGALMLSCLQSWLEERKKKNINLKCMLLGFVEKHFMCIGLV